MKFLNKEFDGKLRLASFRSWCLARGLAYGGVGSIAEWVLTGIMNDVPPEIGL
jgi:hypothetical protein